MADFWVIGPIAWDRVLEVPWLPPSGGFVQESVRNFVRGGGKQGRFRRPQGVAATMGRSR